MPFFENCTLAFESLAVRPFDNSRIGDLSAIHQPGINLVLGTRTFSPEAQARLQELDVIKLAQQHGTCNGPIPQSIGGIGGDENVHPAKLLSSIGPVLERILPAHPGNHAVAQDLALILGDTAATYDNAPLTYYFHANLPGNSARMHHDTFAEHRWLLTMPTGKSKGTLLADDFILKHPVLADSDPQAGTQFTPRHNQFGRPSALWTHLIRQAPTGRILGWHGTETGTPRIHMEALVNTPAEARLTVIATPTDMQQRESARRRAYTP